MENLRETFKELFDVDINAPEMGGVFHPGHEALVHTTELDSLFRQIFPNASAAQLHALDKIVNGRIDGHASYFATAFAANAKALQNKPNASFTLYGPTAGTGITYAPNTPINLVPHNGGAPMTTGFAFSDDMYFFSVSTEKVDAVAGWRLVIFKWADDPISNIQNDTSFSIYEEEADFLRSPLGAYRFRRFKAPTLLNATAVHSRAAAQELICGVTVLYRDVRCKTNDKQFVSGVGDNQSLADLVRALVSHRASRVGRASFASPIGGGANLTKLLGV